MLIVLFPPLGTSHQRPKQSPRQTARGFKPPPALTLRVDHREGGVGHLIRKISSKFNENACCLWNVAALNDADATDIGAWSAASRPVFGTVGRKKQRRTRNASHC